MRAPEESVLVADTDLEGWVAALREETCTRVLSGVVCKNQGEKRMASLLPGSDWLGTTQWQAIFASD